MDLLRLATAGSVDDGKSTLIGRLLYETGSVPKDRLEAIEAASRRRGAEGLDLSLLTDGLIAEREQGITIDVAHVYFATSAAPLHHRGHAGPRGVHAQHGHGRVDGGRLGDPDRRAQRPRSSRRIATTSSPPCSASRPSSSA